jgi:hypothetical protein
MYRRLGGPQNRSGRCEEEIILDLTGTRTPTPPTSSPHHPVAVPAALSRLPHFFVYYLVCEAIDTAATPGLLCQPRVIGKKIVEKQMECRLPGETEVLGENLPQRHFCPSQNPT